MRQKIVAGNWKMNCDLAEMEELLAGIKNNIGSVPNDVQLMVAPSFTNLHPAFESLRETNVKVVAQNMHQSESGAFTGEVSPSMLKSIGIETVIIGHSERRSIFNETDAVLAEKVSTALKHGMTVVFCFGEELKDRKADQHFEVVKQQLKEGLFHINDADWDKIILAYEPVWAIGTGLTPTLEEINNIQYVENKLYKKSGHGLSIYNAIKFGALLENVVYNSKNREINFNDNSKTENTRVSYPLSHIKNSLISFNKDSKAGHPNKIIFLTCDAYGVLPPISKLNNEQTMYHFISGYTAKVAGTERGISEPVATFSPCYGGPFLTLHPLIYAELLNKKIKEHNVEVFLVNTGWIGGNPNSGANRISIKNTRLMINAILEGLLDNTYYTKEKYFGLSIPDYVKGVNKKILNPINAWKNKQDYDKEARKLAYQFRENFKIYGKEVEYLINSGPLV